VLLLLLVEIYFLNPSFEGFTIFMGFIIPSAFFAAIDAFSANYTKLFLICISAVPITSFSSENEKLGLGGSFDATSPAGVLVLLALVALFSSPFAFFMRPFPDFFFTLTADSPLSPGVSS